MIWKREWIEFIDATQFSTEFMALNRMFSWHGMGGTQSGIEKDRLQSLVLHPWMLALYIRINILFTCSILQDLAFSETFILWFPLLYFLLKEHVQQLSSVLYVSYYYSLRARIYALVSHMHVAYKSTVILVQIWPSCSVNWTSKLFIYLYIFISHICCLISIFSCPFQNHFFKIFPLDHGLNNAMLPIDKASRTL